MRGGFRGPILVGGTMLRFFQDLSLTYKNLLATLLSLTAFAALWLGVIAHFTALQAKTQEIRSIATRVRVRALEARRDEKDFLLSDVRKAAFYESGTPETEPPLSKAIGSLRREIDSLAPFADAGLIARESFADLRRLAEKYEGTFQRLVSALRQRGYRRFGGAGRWAEALAVLERERDRAKNPPVRQALEELVKLGRSAVADGELEDADKTLRETAGLLEAARGRSPDGALAAALDEFESALAGIERSQKRLGSTEQAGLRGEVRATADEIEAVADKVLRDAVSAEERAWKMFRLMLLIGGAAGLALGGVIAVRLARRLTSRILALTAAMDADLAGKGLRRRLEVANRDEIGRMTETFNRMTDEMNRTQGALTTLEEHHEAMMRSLGEGIIATDVLGRVESMNPAASAMTGFENEEARGKAPREVFHIVDRTQKQRLEDPFARTDKERATVAVSDPVLLISNTGVETPILYTCSPILDKNGAMQGVVLAFQDTTRLEKVMRTLQESERQYHQMVDASKDLFWLAAADLQKFLYAGPPFDLLWGRRRQELYGNAQLWWQGIHPDDRDRVRETVQGKVLSGENYRLEYRVSRPDGSVRWVEENGSAVKNFKGQVYRVCGIVRDITDEKAADQSIRSMADAFASCPDALVVTGLDGRILACNAGLERLLGWAAAELRGNPSSKLLPADRQEELAQVLAMLREGHVLEDYQTVRVRKDGGQVLVAVSSFPLLDAAGKPVGGCQLARAVRTAVPGA